MPTAVAREAKEFFSQYRTDEECIEILHRYGQAKWIEPGMGRIEIEELITDLFEEEMIDFDLHFLPSPDNVARIIDPETSSALDAVLDSEIKKEETTPVKKKRAPREENPKVSHLGKEIVRFYKDACYGNGINGTISMCNTEKSDKSRKWAATFDKDNNPVWECCTCGCQWPRSERK